MGYDFSNPAPKEVYLEKAEGSRGQGDKGTRSYPRAHLPTCQPAPSPLCGAYIRSTGSMPSRRRPVSMTAQVREQSMRRRAFTAGSSTITLSAA